MEYSRAVATGLNYLETQYGIEVNAVEVEDGILFEGKHSKSPIVVFSRSKLNPSDFIVSFRDISEKAMFDEIKSENAIRLSRRVKRTQDKLRNKYGIMSTVSKSSDKYGEEIIITDRRTSLPVARIVITDPVTLQYSESLFYPNNIKTARKARRKKFVLQGLGAAVLIGALFIGGRHVYSEVAQPKVDITASLPGYSVSNANDLLLFNWSNYVMGEIADVVNSSEYISDFEYDNIYANYFVPVMSSYYNYQEQLESPLPAEFSLSSEYHGKFRQAAGDLNERLSKSIYFENLTFEKSPYAMGVVVNENGIVLLNLSGTADGYALPSGEIISEALAGEMYDDSGSLINANDAGSYDVLIPYVKVKNNNYSVDNMPADAKVINGVMYVSEDHLDDFEETNSKVK